MHFDRVILIVLDSVGVGDAPDAEAYGDTGADTLGNISRRLGRLELPNLGHLGLGNVVEILGTPPDSDPVGAFGRLTERSAGKDTTTGHWEIAGLHIEQPFPTFPGGFPDEILEAFVAEAGYDGILGNVAISGTVIIENLGVDHLDTGLPIVYTSADSVFQIAAHEEHFGLDELYRCCGVARRVLDPYGVGRVIARPFVGDPVQGFLRTKNRRDYSLRPPRPTVLEHLCDADVPVVAVGKISDIFAGVGIDQALPTGSNAEGIEYTLDAMTSLDHGLIMTNLVDFDVYYGHRRDVAGYAHCLEAFDRALPEILRGLRPRDLLILTADHGNDPTMPGSDHTRERVPLLACGPRSAAGVDLGTGESFADIAATVAEIFHLPSPEIGTSFLGKIL